MAKYDPLWQYLYEEDRPEFILSYEQIVRILGADLPRSAYIHRAWWGNETDPDTRNVQCRAWLTAGYTVFYVALGIRVIFRRIIN